MEVNYMREHLDFWLLRILSVDVFCTEIDFEKIIYLTLALLYVDFAPQIIDVRPFSIKVWNYWKVPPLFMLGATFKND